MAEQPGEEFGPYRLEEVIGRGGMGVVYRAYDTRRDRTVALKRLPREMAADEHFQARFRRESRLAARLNEPHIIPIHDFGEHDGQLFIDMRLVEGVDLSKLISDEGGALGVDLAVDIIVQVSAALSAAHNAGLMHRDIKPSNVLISGMTPDERTSPFAYLVDFGIARAIGNEGTALTSTTDWFGTVAYMAPERISGSSGDVRSDIYSLACLLYQCLTGQAPFTGEALQVLFAHVNNPPPSASAKAPAVPPGLDATIRRGMAKKPDERYQTVAQFAAAVKSSVRDARTATGSVPLVPGPGIPGGPPHSFPPRGQQSPQSPQGAQSSFPPRSGPPQSFPPRSGPPQSFPPRSGPPQSIPPQSVPPRAAGPANSLPPRGPAHRAPDRAPDRAPGHPVAPHAGPPTSIPPRAPAPAAAGSSTTALKVMIVLAVVVTLAAIIAVIVAVNS